MSHYVGRQEILGREEIMGSALSKTVGAIKKVAGLPLDAAAWALRRTPVPSKSMFIGRDEIMGAFVGDEARALAEDTRGERAAARRSGTCGYNSHWNYIKGELPELSPADLATVQALAQKGNKKARRLLAKMGKLAKQEIPNDKSAGEDVTSAERQQARQILKSASAGKSISRADLKKAIWLYAGKQSTEKERTLVGSKMLQFLNQRQVKLAS
jgi:hypothetical protein